jgi:hypothetical protein
VAARALAYGGLSTLLPGLLADAAAGDQALDVQILQTASSLEQLVVDTYNDVLTRNLGDLAGAPGTAAEFLRTFVTATMMHHNEHKRAFQDQTRLLGAPEQSAPNPRFQGVVERRVPTLRTPNDVVELAAILEKVATDTYLLNLTLLEDTRSMALMAAVMGVEAQHLATLRLVGGLLEADAPQLVKVPIGADVANLPRVAGSVAFPDALAELNPPDLVADPPSGAVG